MGKIKLSLTREQVLEALKNIAPESGTDIVTSGVMRALNVDGASVRFVMEIDPAQAEAYVPVKTKAEDMLKSMGAADISVVMTAHKSASAPPDLKVQKKPNKRAQKRFQALIAFWPLHRAKVALENQPSVPIWPVLWPQKDGVLAYWMRMFMAHRNPACWGCRAVHQVQMAKPSCRCAITVSR